MFVSVVVKPDRQSLIADTCVLIDHTFGRDAASVAIIGTVAIRKLELFVTDETKDEFHATKHFLARWRYPVNLEITNAALRLATTVTLLTDPHDAFPHLGVLDATFVQLLRETEADVLVTRDKGIRRARTLLPDEYRQRILTPQECLALPWMRALVEEPRNR